VETVPTNQSQAQMKKQDGDLRQQNLSRKTKNETTSRFATKNENQDQDLGSGGAHHESRNLVGAHWHTSGNQSAKPR
jgi:hypothetical protein